MDLIRCESLYPWEIMDMPSARLPRFRRAPPIMLTKSDREVIRRVVEYRFLRSTHLLSPATEVASNYSAGSNASTIIRAPAEKPRVHQLELVVRFLSALFLIRRLNNELMCISIKIGTAKPGIINT